MSGPNRKREVQVNFRVSPQELEMIEQKMAQLGTSNREAYLRKMALDGYVVKLELPELKELVSLMRYSSNNLNQLTRRVHETGRIYDADPVCLVLRWSGLYLRSGSGACQYGAGAAGRGGADYLLAAERTYPACTGVSGQPLRTALGSHLAVGKGTGFEVCHSRCGVQINQNKIKSSGCRGWDYSPAISCFPFVLVRLYF